MDTFSDLMMGFSIALSPENLMFAFIGSILGTLVGVLPGIGSTAAVAILIPVTFELPPTGAIIMLSAILYGCAYGGTITSVLMNVPGEPSSTVTCLDGHQMAKRGRAGAALAIAAIGSYVGGTAAVMGLVIAAPPLVRMAVEFGPPEFLALITLGLSLLMALAGKSMMRALLVGVLGLLLATIGMDLTSGIPRFTFGQPELLDGLGFIPIIMGMFGVGDILLNAETGMRQVLQSKVGSLMLTRKEMGDSVAPILRGTVLGFFLGIIPGMTAVVSAFMSYIVEKKVSSYPEKFGTGVIEGVAGPETANNSHANAALIPLFTLGIPTNPTFAVLLSAFVMNGLTPGPMLFRDHPDVAWGVIASLYIGNVILLILNLPLVGMWVSILRIPYSILFTLILVFTLIGSYSLNSSAFDVGVMACFGVLGYIFKKLDFPLAPFALTFVLGSRLEVTLGQSMAMFEGDITQILNRPVAAVLLGLALLVLISPALRLLPSRLNEVRQDTD